MTTPAEMATIQAPVAGLNWREPPTGLKPTEALHLENILPRPSSGELRAGYEEYCVGLPAPVKTLGPYIGLTQDQNRLFAFCEQGGIYDVTEKSKTPTESKSTSQTDGVWSYINFSGVDKNFLCAVSPEGGYWTFNPEDGWVQETLTGDAVDKKFSAIFQWKDRVWLIEQNSTRAYYLGVAAITGDATLFDFHGVIRHGGYLSWGTNWTFDAGYDLSDYFVLGTSNGDIIVYEGINPSEVSTFSLKGVWNVGRLPSYGRSLTHFGGELFFMSNLGVVPMSALVNGKVANEYQVASAKIQPSLNTVFDEWCNTFGWEMHMVYQHAFVLLKTPEKADGTHLYYVMNVQTGAWGQITQMPMLTAGLHNDEFYFGTSDGRVCKAFVGHEDGVQFDGTEGAPIVGHYLGGYSDFGKPGAYKVFQMARPFFNATSAPSVNAKVATGYDFGFPTIEGEYAADDNLGRFDVSNWNECLWAGSQNTYSAWEGLSGIGYFGAFMVSYTGPRHAQFLNSTLTFQVGGVM